MPDPGPATTDGRPRPRPSASRTREDQRFRDEHPRSIALRERARASMPNGVPMAWHMSSYHDAPPWVAEGRGCPVHRCRRPHLPRLQHRGPLDVLRLRARAAGPRRERPDRPGEPVPAARRGRDRRLRGAGPTIRPAEVAVHALGEPGQHRGHPGGPRRDRPRQGRSSSTGTTWGTSTRPSSRWPTTADWSPRNAACRRRSPSRPSSCRSTTSMP